ncbi:MAG: hypothetical protein HYZ85_04950 [Candidatus Omnitrophica bacterium]|nr:hypothetical protein [Candidatus Omnitrophota bacterium]
MKNVIGNAITSFWEKSLASPRKDYQKLLKDASRGMSKIESLNHLMGLIVHFITMKMDVKNAAVLNRDKGPARRRFRLDYQRGYQKNYLEYFLEESDPLICFLTLEQLALTRDQIKNRLKAGLQKTGATAGVPVYDYPSMAQTMKELGAECLIPSFLGRELNHILILGEKKSGGKYTAEDISTLSSLAQESAIAIENARLYDEAVVKTRELERINDQLEYSKTLLVKALQETEVANKQLQDTQAQLIHEQKMATLGRLAASVGHEVNNPLTILSMNISRAILKYRKDPETKIGDILDLFSRMEQNIGRIKAVVNTLTGLLKKSEKGKFEPLSLKLILEETLPLVQFQTYLDNLSGTEVEFDMPGSLPLVRGDLERLQEVFLNLFINAYHAMQGRRHRKIKIWAVQDPENRHFVSVHFQDNGCGMNEDVIKKIFNYGFTTKPPGKGSGMGLYMCKYIIELHGGTISVESKPSEGTTFTIRLPVYEEIVTSSGEIQRGVILKP